MAAIVAVLVAIIMHVKEPGITPFPVDPLLASRACFAVVPLWLRSGSALVPPILLPVCTGSVPPPLRDPTVRRAGRAKRARGAREARSPSLLGARSAPLPPRVPGSRGQSGAARRQARAKQRRNTQGCHATPEELNFPEGRRGGAVRLRDSTHDP